MSATRPAKAGISRTDIRDLLGPFYDRVRKDPDLGPIFHAHVGESDADWQRHLARIESFWANVMCHERSYDGNPMQVHMKIPGIGPHHFTRWLAIFQDTAKTVLPPDKAQAFDVLARRIGASLSMGINRVRAAGVPDLASFPGER